MLVQDCACRMGLTRVLQDWALMSCGQLVMFLLRNESELLAFLIVDCVCIFHERLFGNICVVDTKVFSTFV